MNPLVSVCIPTYNGAKFILEALNSIANQTYDNLEIIVSDDNSIDDTLSIVNSFINVTTIPICICHHPPNGIGGNWNNCMEKANGEYIKFLFQDDVLEPDCIKLMMEAFSVDSKVKLVASKRKFILEEDSKNDIIDEWISKYGDLQKEFVATLPNGNIILDKTIFKRESFLNSPLNKIGEPSTVLFRKSLIKEIGWFNEDLKQILDYEYWYRILKKNKIIVINQLLVSFRIHSMQATNVNRNNDIRDYAIYDKILFDNYYKLLHKNTQRRLYNQFGFWIKCKRKGKKILKKILNK
ncbi:glycosyltransferase family 2 protein [Flavobacterium sp. 3-210]